MDLNEPMDCSNGTKQDLSPEAKAEQKQRKLAEGKVRKRKLNAPARIAKIEVMEVLFVGHARHKAAPSTTDSFL